MPLTFWGYIAPREGFPKVKAWALKALETDGQLAEALVPLASELNFYEHDWEASESALQRAIELNPNYPRAHQVYAEFLAYIGEFETSAHESRQALLLDPLSPILHVSDAIGSYFARCYDEVIAKCERALELEPRFPIAYHTLGIVLEAQGEFESAVEHLQKGLELEQHNLILRSELGRAYALSGRQSEAENVLRALDEIAKHRYVSAYFVAKIYAGLRDKRNVFAWLERATEERSSWMVMLKADPAFDSFRSDPQFEDLLQQARLPGRNTIATPIHSEGEK